MHKNAQDQNLHDTNCPCIGSTKASSSAAIHDNLPVKPLTVSPSRLFYSSISTNMLKQIGQQRVPIDMVYHLARPSRWIPGISMIVFRNGRNFQPVQYQLLIVVHQPPDRYAELPR